MAFRTRLHVWGERACFTRPEMKVERVSYDMMTPSAARGILEAIYWKPEMLWVVDRIHVLRPIRFQSFRRNEVGLKASTGNASKAMNSGDLAGIGLAADRERQQRATMLLTDVGYVIEASVETIADSTLEALTKHLSVFNRRADTGQCYHRPCLGTREFPAYFTRLPFQEPLPASTFTDRNLDLGWMLHDIDYGAEKTSRFFRAQLRNGVLDVHACLEQGIMS